MHGMAVAEQVLSGARRRAAALAARDEGELRGLLHPRFVWTSHAGERFDLESYLASNLRGSNEWAGQQIADSEVTVVGDTAVLRCTAMDRVDAGTGAVEVFVMPMTQVWVLESGRWLCLAGHAGPRIMSGLSAGEPDGATNRPN